MQATLDSIGLKHLTRALTCLSKFGDDLAIVATPDTFALSATNTAMTAYGRFKYPRSFFSRYNVATYPAGQDELPAVSGQIVIKHLLSIFKNKTSEKACEKCELVISDGPTQRASLEDDDEEHDALESRLTVRLHCKHGVVKTHRLSLNPLEKHQSPSMPDSNLETSFTVGPKTMKNILEHFPIGKGTSKTDPQLIWNFHDQEVVLRSFESGVDGKGRPHLITELTIGATEFDTYDLSAGEVTIAFHLREFNATIAFAEASEVSLHLRFTDPLDPLYISVDADYADTLFVIATSMVVSRSQQQNPNKAPTPRNPRKRAHNEMDGSNHLPAQNGVGGGRRAPMRPTKPAKVVHTIDVQAVAREMRPVPPPMAEPQPSWAVLTAAQEQQQGRSQSQSQSQSSGQQFENMHSEFEFEMEDGPARASGSSTRQLETVMEKAKDKEPLFLPESQISHLPPASQAAIIATGLGIEHMTAEELAMMLDGDADIDELDMDTDTGGEGGQSRANTEEDWQMGSDRELVGYGQQPDSFELVDDDDFEMAPTQNERGKTFRPLFRD